MAGRKVKILNEYYPIGVAKSKMYHMHCVAYDESKKKKEEKESVKEMNKLDLRLPIMLLGGLPFNTIKGQLGNERSVLDSQMLEACLNPSWIGVLRDMGTVRARLLTALANGIIDMSFGEDNILHFSFSNPKFSGLDIDFNNQNFDDIGFDFGMIKEEPEELLRYVLYIFRESLPHLQREWGFSDAYMELLGNLLDVDVVDDADISLKDLADIYYVNRNRLPWRMFVGNNYGLWEYHYGKDGRTFFDYSGKSVMAGKSSTPMQHVWESSRQMSKVLIDSIIGEKGTTFEVKYDEYYFDKTIDEAVNKRIEDEESRGNEEKGKSVEAVDAVAVEEKVAKSEKAEERVSDVTKSVSKKEEKGTKKKGKKEESASTKSVAAPVPVIEKAVESVTDSESSVAEVAEEVERVELLDDEIEEEVIDTCAVEEKGTEVHGSVRSAVSAATKQFMAAEERAESRRCSVAEIDSALTARSSYVQEKIESNEDVQKRFKEVISGGNSLIVVDCENAKVETIWGNIFRFTSKSTAKGQGGKLWLNARVLFIHDNDTTESADWATMINAFKKMVVVADGIEDIKVSSIKSEKAKSLTDVALGVHVGRLIGNLDKEKMRGLVILSSDSDMAGIIQACKYIDGGIQFGVCYTEQTSGRAYRAWCHTNNVCTFDAEKYDAAVVEKYKAQMYDYIYEERYKEIIKGAVSEMMERKKGIV